MKLKQCKSALRKALLCSLALAVTACATTKADPYTEVQPRDKPIQNTTSVGDSLACMDDMFAAQGVKGIPITIKGLPDATGSAKVGTRDMLISAIAKMSQKSGAFNYIDFQSLADYAATNDYDFTSGAGMIVPKLFIRGAITQFDEGIVATSKGGGARVAGIDVGLNADSTSSIVSVDMNIGITATGQIVPTASASNSIAFRKRGKGGDAGAEIEKNGVFFQFSINRSEGMAQAVRTLIEFNAIETLGKLTGAPYWRCLGISSTNPTVESERRRYFEGLSQEDQITYAQRALSGMKRYSGPIDGMMSPALSDSIGKFQSEQRLQPNGRMDAPTYASLQDYAQVLAGRAAILADVKPINAQTTPLKLSLSRMQPVQDPKVGDTVRVSASLNADGYLYCYYRDVSGGLARIFPNTWQPNALVRANSAIQLPSTTAGFELVLDKPASEESVMCFASRKEFGPALPEELRKPELEFMPVNLTQFVTTVKSVAGPDLAGQAITFKTP